MSRPRIPIGGYGEIAFIPRAKGKVEARTRFRDWDGQTRLVQATGASRPAAEVELKRRLAERNAFQPVDTTPTPDSPFPALVDYWLADLDLDWVLIGHLQTNKAGVVAEVAAEFQALDSLRLAEVLDRRLQALGRRLPVLVQVNSSGEDTKGGFAPDEVPDAVRAISALDGLVVRGLMTLAANTPDQDVVRACFTTMTDLQARLRHEHGGGFDALSMGMSGDYELAVECGSTCVRLGTTIFGARAYPPSR